MIMNILKEFTKYILDGLNWLGIKWDENIQIQSERIDRHRDIAKIL